MKEIIVEDFLTWLPECFEVARYNKVFGEDYSDAVFRDLEKWTNSFQHFLKDICTIVHTVSSAERLATRSLGRGMCCLLFVGFYLSTRFKV